MLAPLIAPRCRIGDCVRLHSNEKIVVSRLSLPESRGIETDFQEFFDITDFLCPVSFDPFQGAEKVGMLF